MDQVFDRVDPERAWAALVAAGLAVLGLGTALFPRRVYAEFVWHYFWGPVYADAKGASCAAWAGGERRLYESAQECAAIGDGAALGPVAEPGYTLVSEVGYVVLLVVALVGVLFLLRRLGVERYRAGFFALFPFMLFGGALRVVEDANNRAAAEGVTQAIEYPLNAFLISPVIYVTVFVVALAAVVAAVYAERRGYVEGYEYPLAGVGFAAFGLAVAYLLVLSLTEGYVEFYPQVALVVLAGATLVTAAVWWAIERYAPGVNAGTRAMGVVVLWAHAVDGMANVVGLDFYTALTPEPFNLTGKHPVNRAIVDLTQGFLPDAVLSVTGDAWPFLLVKIGAAAAIVWLFDEAIFDESPRYAVVLLVAVVAVGLGPGTRDMLRATFGV